MKLFKVLALALIALPMMSLLPVGQQNKAPESKLIQFQMAILKHGPNWSATGNSLSDVHRRHVAYVQSLLESGKAVIAGAIKDDSDLAAVYILRSGSTDEAKAWVMDDPAVTAGHVVVEMHPWWAEDVMKKTTTPQKFTTAYLAFLTRGSRWTPESTPALEELQKNHLANIRRLAEMKKLVVAGPFGDNGVLRGIFVFRVASLAEARELSETDPAVKAGRLALDIHPWSVSEGILP